MFNNRRNHRNKTYRVKKYGIKDENIDRQILAIHRAMVEKILADTSLVAGLTEKLEARREEGRMGYGEYITWLSLLENVDDEVFFREGVLENTTRMRQLRRRTPFVGVLTEEERQKALDEDALGTLPASAWGNTF